MKPLSVIVPAYNAERWINRCIDSILSQEVDAEVIVVDDGSTDQTLARLVSYGDRLRVIGPGGKRSGPGAARNRGLEQARGALITFCDADDWYMPNALRKLLELQRKTAADIVRFSYVRVFPDGCQRPPLDEGFQAGLVEKQDFCRCIYPHFISGIALNSVWGAVFTREIAAQVRFPVQLQTAEDAAFSMDAYTKANRVLLWPEPLYCYCQHSGSLTRNGLRVLQKYRCNLWLAGKTLRLLPQWGMDTPGWRFQTVLRPLRLTCSKLNRLRM